MKNNVNQLKWGSLLTYGQTALSIIIGLIYTPFMIKTLGQSEYGLYNTVSSTISMFSMLNLGFSSGYIRYYARYKANDEKEKIYSLNGLFLIIFSIIALIAFVGGVFLSFNLDVVFNEGLTQEEYPKARILMLFMTLNMTFSFLMTVIRNIITSHERFVFLKSITMITTVVSPLVNVPLLLLGFKSIGLVVSAVSLAFIVDIIQCIYVFKYLKTKFVFKNFEKGLFKSLFAYSAFIALNMIIDQINWNIDKLLLARFKGTSIVAVYSVGYSLYNYYMSFSTAVSGVFTPRIHKIVNETKDNLELQRRQLTNLFTRVGRIQLLILGLIGSGIVFFGKSFILNIWAGKGYEDSYYVALLIVLPSSIALIQNLGIEIQRAKNMHQFRSIVYFFMALINLGLSIVLCQKYGAIGSAIGTAISLVAANGLIMNVYYHKKINLDIIFFWKSILNQSKGLIMPIIVGVLITKFVNLNSIPMLLLSIVVYSIIYCASEWLIGMNTYEKELVKKPVVKILKKVKRV